MEQVGINSNVYAGGKIFHIQTSGSFSELLIQSEIFEAGRIISVVKKKISDAPKHFTEEDFREHVKTHHHEISWEVELLFFMRDKIRTTTHTLSNIKIGLLFLRKGFVDEAIVEFEYIIKKEPDHIESYNHLGNAFIQKGAYQDAINILKRGRDLKPQFPDVRNNLGFAYGKARMFSESLVEYQAAIAINPNYIIVYLNTAITYLESLLNADQGTGLPEQAERIKYVLDMFNKTLITNPEFASYRFYTFRFEKITKLVSTNSIAQAIETILEVKDAIQKPSLDETIHGFYLKFLFGGAGKDEKIIAKYRLELERSIEENQNYADLHNSLGLVYLIQCRNLFLKAMTAFKKAYEINPAYKSAYKNFRLVQNDGREFLNLLRAILK